MPHFRNKYYTDFKVYLNLKISLTFGGICIHTFTITKFIANSIF